MIKPTFRQTPRSIVLLALFTFACSAFAKTVPDHWVGTWATAPCERANTDGKMFAEDTTLRQTVHVSLGGSSVRIELSNQFGSEPLTIGGANLASGAGPAITGAAKLTFSGHPSIVIPPGASVVSDPAALTVGAAGDLTVSLFLPAQKMSHLTVHGSAFQTNYSVSGNALDTDSLSAPKRFSSWLFLKAVDVKAPEADAAIVAFGDSITDGAASTMDTNHRWPDELVRRLQADKATAGLSVLNVGIGGNRVLHDGTGPSALTRFDHDVLAQSGVKYVIVLESINDIGHAYDPKKPYDVVSADDLIAGFTQMVERAHMHGIKFIGATLTPYAGAGYSSPEGEKVRQAVNEWIRNGKVVDGVIDFDAATRDPANPDSFLPAYNGNGTKPGDHLHPNDAGMKAMAAAIDLKLFTTK